jgi:hypothetical protein
MAFKVEIWQDRRRLTEWVFDLIVSVAKGRAG